MRKIIDAIFITAAEICLDFIEPWSFPRYKGTTNIMSFPVKELRRLLNCYKTETQRKSLRRLKQNGLVEFINKNNVQYIRLTKKGLKRYKELALEKMVIKKPKKWNGRWRIIIFDIPNNKTRMRNVLREKLKFLGFYALQESVYIHPFASVSYTHLTLPTIYSV